MSAAPSCATYAAPYTPSYGANVELRPLEPGDRATVLEVFAGLGRRSRELRFMAPKPHLTGADLRQLTTVDGHDHVAVAATVDGQTVGIARFVRLPDRPDSADVAIAVVDAWQGVGVGTMLASALAECAVRLGVHRFTMAMSPDNEAAVRLLHRAPGRIERLAIDESVAEFALTLTSDEIGAWA
jgi:GNAT superfamily N-acetyltransferase